MPFIALANRVYNCILLVLSRIVLTTDPEERTKVLKIARNIILIAADIDPPRVDWFSSYGKTEFMMTGKCYLYTYLI